LLQFISGLTKLRALHIIQFRAEDTCMWVMREVRKFAVDTVSHNPELKLEYLALDSNVDRLVRRVKKTTAKPKGKGAEKNGKGKKTDSQSLSDLMLGLGVSGAGESASPASSIELDWEDNSTDDEAAPLGKLGLKVETIEGLSFHDATGVRIFEQDIVNGRL